MVLKKKEKVTNRQPSGSCSHGTQKQEKLIFNQVAPAHKVIKQISKLPPCGFCSPGMQKQEQPIYNQVAPARMIINNNK